VRQKQGQTVESRWSSSRDHDPLTSVPGRCAVKGEKIRGGTITIASRETSMNQSLHSLNPFSSKAPKPSSVVLQVDQRSNSQFPLSFKNKCLVSPSPPLYGGRPLTNPVTPRSQYSPSNDNASHPWTILAAASRPTLQIHCPIIFTGEASHQAETRLEGHCQTQGTLALACVGWSADGETGVWMKRSLP